MKAIGTVLLVLVAMIGMAGPVLGAASGSSAGTVANGFSATQYSQSWADNGWEYAEAGTTGGVIIGETASASGAEASDSGMYADAGTLGYSEGIIVGTESLADSHDDDSNGVTDAGADSYATGSDVSTNGGAGSTTYPSSYAWADGYAFGFPGYAESSAGADAYIP